MHTVFVFFSQKCFLHIVAVLVSVKKQDICKFPRPQTWCNVMLADVWVNLETLNLSRNKLTALPVSFKHFVSD